MAEIAANNEMIETYDLSMIMSRLNLGWTPQFPSYEEVFPSQWANNSQVESRHKQIVRRIQNWPYDQNNEVIMSSLSPLISIFIFQFNYKYIIPRNLVSSRLSDRPFILEYIIIIGEAIKVKKIKKFFKKT